MRLLSIDWDYFIPTRQFDPEQWMLYDWTMKDAIFYREPSVWLHRGAAFLNNNLPLPDTSGLEQTFWQRFQFAPGANLYYGDSHLYAATIPERHDVSDVWNFDAHHDLGYTGTPESILEGRKIECDNWLGIYKAKGRTARVFYPAWRPDARKEEAKPVFKGGWRKIDNGRPVPVLFGAVYVCRSSAWSPAWLDAKFKAFMEASPLFDRKVNLQGDYDVMMPRECSREDIERAANEWKMLREMDEKRRQQNDDTQLESINEGS